MCCSALLGRLGGAGRPASEIRLHLQEDALACFEIALAAVELVRVRREPHLRVLERRRRRASTTRPGVAADSADGVRELALARLDRRDALRQLDAESPQLLLGGDADRAQALVLALDRDRLVLLACRTRPRVDDMRGPAVLLLRATRRARGALPARARRTISSRSPKRRRAFSTRSVCQSSCRRASSSLIWLCTDVSSPSESCCQSSWRSSEMRSISVWMLIGVTRIANASTPRVCIPAHSYPKLGEPILVEAEVVARARAAR